MPVVLRDQGSTPSIQALEGRAVFYSPHRSMWHQYLRSGSGLIQADKPPVTLVMQRGLGVEEVDEVWA